MRIREKDHTQPARVAGPAGPVVCFRWESPARRCRAARGAPGRGPRRWEAPGLDAYPLHTREREDDERDTLRTVLDRGPPARSGRGLTPTPARSLAGRPAGGSRPVGARGMGPAGG